MPAEFNWEDPLDLESQLTGDERMIRDAARAFCNDKLAPRVKQAFRDEKFDRAIMNEVGRDGLSRRDDKAKNMAARASAMWPMGWWRGKLSASNSGYRSAMSVQNSLVMHPIEAYGTEDQCKKYLPRLATGEIVGCFGLTEPDAGSDPGGMKTKAKRVQGGFLLNGSKMWITNSPIADVAVVWGKLDDEGIRGFLVERGTKGFSTPIIEGKVSLRASVTGELFWRMSNCRKRRCCPRPQELAGPFGCLNKARYGIAWGVMGAAEDCWHRARQYTLDRKQFGKPLGRQPVDPEKASRHANGNYTGYARRVGVGARLGTGRCGTAGHFTDEAQQLRQGARHRAGGARHARRQRNLG